VVVEGFTSHRAEEGFMLLTQAGQLVKLRNLKFKILNLQHGLKRLQSASHGDIMIDEYDVKQALSTEEEFDEDLGPSQEEIDLKEAIGIITSAKVLMDFMGDRNLKRAINNADRAIMFKLSERMRVFLNNTDLDYGENIN
jgi:hypothetical protein